MGIWDKIKESTSNMIEINEIEKKIKKSMRLSEEEITKFTEIKGISPEEDEQNNPTKYFYSTKNTTKIDIDEKRKLFKIDLFKVHHFDELFSYELLEDGKEVVTGGVGIGRALVGGALFGGVGAIVGGFSKKKKTTETCSKIEIRYTLKSGSQPNEYIKLLNKKVEKSSGAYERAMKQARDILSTFDLIANDNEKDPAKIEIVSNSYQSTDIADQIKKFKELLDMGAITQEEFDKKKQELLQ
ncbi:TPA_asm: SHOCT domain-containing protein [Listeria monocytogenes]|nr:SHOCT domain-containing protein [Listeria monocytogenes]